MKWLRLLTVVAATLGMNTVSQAGLTESLGLNDGCCKSCAPAPTCQPQRCKPTITRPCEKTVHTYQRKISTLKPPCCKTQCAPKRSCCPVTPCCPTGFAPRTPPQPAPAPQAQTAPQPLPESQSLAARPVSHDCCQPRQQQCCPQPKQQCCHRENLFKRLFDGLGSLGGRDRCCPQPKQQCCPQPKQQCCPQPKQKQCCADPCEIAELIYQSQTACYARQRRKAIDKIGDKFDCTCNPEIMDALVYALNDADESVRAEAADEIGDQIKKADGCCCTEKVVAALKAALADCDWRVRRQAEEALEACGYCIVEGCCPTKPRCCHPGGHVPSHGCDGGSSHSAPAPAEAEPAPAPPAAAIRAPGRRPSSGNRLASLFGLLD